MEVIRLAGYIAEEKLAIAKNHLWPRQLERAGVKSARPVSYTHLRAHETVLDLVCRLLLEKKNTKTLTLRYAQI